MEEKQSRKKGNLLAGILRVIAVVIFVFVLGVALLLTVPRFFGYEPFIVVSRSMEPSIRVGGTVYVKSGNPLEYEEGDIVCFYMNAESETPTTHRVVENDRREGMLVTKGDANEKEDIVPIPYEYVVGKVGFYINGLGYLLAGLNSLYGKLLYLALFLIGVILLELSSVLRRKRSV